MPRPALAHAVSAVRPAAVFVWSQMPGTADPALLDGLPATARLVAGGPGWQRAALPARVHLAAALGDAADLLAECAFAVP